MIFISYRLEPHEPLATGLKRIVHEQIDRALEQLAEAPEGRDEGVHDARKRFKKIRAVLRLVRDEIGQEVYQPENVFYRDAGRRLSDVRDSFVMIETLAGLTDYYSDPLAAEAYAHVRTQLMEQHEAFKQHLLDDEEAMAEVAVKIEQGRARVANWPIERNDFSALYGGLKRVYKRGYKGLAGAYREPVAENFHDWRKRVKYLWYHMRILKPLWPDLLGELADALHDLSDYLGDDHDLAEFRQLVLDRPEMFNDEPELQALLGLIDRRRAELEAAARPLGERIYVEKPKAFVNRLAAYWPVWQQRQLAEQEPVP